MAKKYKDIEIGDVYGRWTVINKGEKHGKENKQYWMCQCSCEKHTVREINNETLKNGRSASCGCKIIDTNKKLEGKFIKELTGQTFGKLTVIKFDGYRYTTRKRCMWLCKCDCGNEIIVESSSLTTGHTKSCGCLSRNDLTGRKFGKLKVIGKSDYWTEKYKTVTYECLCDCGNTTYVRHSSLACNKITACGCVRSEIEDLSGRKYGDLTVIRFLRKRYYDDANVNIWECKCKCGKIVEVTQNNLKKGNTQSCGCESKSHGEMKISEILNKWGVTFKEQYKFEDCKYKYKLPFDFAIFNKNRLSCLIEFDGEFHTQPVRIGNITQNRANENLIETRIRDNIKTEYCKKHHIPLIRIPYWELDEGNLEYILFDSLVKYGVIKEIKSA